MKLPMILALVLFAASAQAGDTQASGHTETAMSLGTITKIDSMWNKLTIDHGPLENLEMEAMTMVFEVADPAMINGLSEGQQITFVADRVRGKLTVTRIQVD